MHFVWRIPDSLAGEMLIRNMSIVQELWKTLPTYNTHAMRQKFINLFGCYTNSKPAFLREVYQRLTDDVFSASTTAAEEVDLRVAKLLETEDPGLIWDLRVQMLADQNRSLCSWKTVGAIWMLQPLMSINMMLMMML